MEKAVVILKDQVFWKIERKNYFQITTVACRVFLFEWETVTVTLRSHSNGLILNQSGH